MRASLTVLVDGAPRDVLVDLAPDDTVAALETALRSVVGVAGSGLWGPTGELAPDATIAEAGVRAGAVLGLAGPVGPAVAVARAEVHVVSGPDAGLVLPLADGDTVLGRAQLPGAGIAARQLGLHLGPAGAVATDLSGEAAGEATAVTDLLEVGADLLSVVPATAPTAAVAPDGLGLLVTRPPRLRPATTVRTVALPEEPRAPEPRRLAVLPLLLPVVLGVVMAVLSSPLFLLFTLVSPLVAASTWWGDRRSGRRTAVRDAAAYAEAVTAADEQVRLQSAAETAVRREACPDPAALLRTATGPGPRLWERRRTDDDALLLRVGSAAQQAVSVRVTGPSSAPLPDQPLLRDVPVTVALREVGVLGVAGPPAAARALARSLVAQVAVLHSPRDLLLWVLVDPGADRDWSWVRWLPHAQAPDGTVLLGTDADTLTARVTELGSLVAERVAATADVRGQLALRSLPDVVVLLDGARALRALPGMGAVLRDGPRVGVHVVCVDEQERLLPEECQAVATCDDTGRLRLRRSGADDEPDVRGDLVTAAWAEQVARGLAPLRDGTAEEGGGRLPDSARLLDVLGLPSPSPEQVLARWGRTSRAVVGVGADGPFALDLREDGPHALVAGTTGSGKSEFLQTLVASLALANRPDALTFVLVDYKGGAAFRDCARLPHTVGMVTDLDGTLVERALASLTAELKTRELLLGAAGAKDVEDLWAAGGALARLVIVVDEFASLAEELPEFVKGLVGIAQRGRSLGVHLVLATQRPSGVVSPEARANTNLRIALRVTDAGESQDVVDAPDAATIARSTPGRAWVRTGHSTLVPFQSARVGGRAPGAVTGERPPVLVVPQPAPGAPLPPERIAEAEPDQDATDLHALVEAVRAAAELAGLPPARSPWLPPLPELVPLGSLPAVRVPGSAPGARRDALQPVVFGVEDVPAEQAVRPAVLDLEDGSHLLVVGAARTGRTTLLRTLAHSLATTVSPSDAHLYVLDCGNGGLLPLADLQHCGAVVTRTQVERAERLLTRLTTEVARRQELLADRGFAGVAEQRAASADPLPYLVLLLDRWEGFLAAFDEVDAGRLTDLLLRLLREGPGAGLRAVVTGDRTALVGKLPGLVEDTLVLRMADRGDYSLAGLAPRQVPAELPAGRALRPATGTQVQVAVLSADGSTDAEELAALAASQTGRVGRRPFRVDVLPSRVTVAEALALGTAGPGVLVGVGGDELAAVTVDLGTHGPGFTVAGPPRSGRSTALLCLTRSLLAAGTPVCVLAPRPSPLRDLEGLLHLDTSADPSTADLVAVLNAASGPLAVVVDDAELLLASDVGDVLQQVLRDGRDQGHVVLVGGTTEELAGSFRGFVPDARKSRAGLLLSPASHLEGELLGTRLPRSAAFTGPAGRALLLLAGQSQLVQVPLP